MKKLKKLMSMGMAAMTILSTTLPASAASISCNEAYEEPDTTNLVLVSEEEVEFDDGLVANVEMYVEDGLETYTSNCGQRSYTCTATFYESKARFNIVKICVSGTFHWDSDADRAYVDDDAKGTYEMINTYFEPYSEDFGNGSDKGGLGLGKKYAYIEKSVTLKNTSNNKMTYTLKFDVNVNGDTHYHVNRSADVEVI